MLQRLRDKAPNVRAEAAAVLARLAMPDEVRRPGETLPFTDGAIELILLGVTVV